jgi:Uma2 family endonuclease
MTTAATLPPPNPTRLYTIADLDTLPRTGPQGPVDYELDNGRLVTVAPPGDLHGVIQSNLVEALKAQGQRRGFGQVRSEAGLVLWRRPEGDRLVGADVAFVAAARLPVQRSSEGYLETIPDLVVEVRSKNDSDDELEQKVRDYLTAGVRCVWVVDPGQRWIAVHRPGQPPRVFTESEEVTIDDIIPGFRLAVADALAD